MPCELVNSLLPALFDETALQVTSFTQPSSTVRFVQFTSLDYNAQTLTLSFDEPVTPESVNISAMSVASTPFAFQSPTFLRFGTGEVTSSIGPSVTIRLSDSDAELLARLVFGAPL